MGNLLSRQALDLYVQTYANADLRRPNGLLEGGSIRVPDRAWFQQQQAETLARLAARDD
jgi:hypothetical protein